MSANLGAANGLPSGADTLGTFPLKDPNDPSVGSKPECRMKTE